MTETRNYGHRNRRKREVRASTVRIDHTATAFVRSPRALPMYRSECIEGERPCPYVSCRYNLYLDVSPEGNIKLNFPDLEPEDMPPERSCALDVASRGGVNLDTAAELINVTRERARQIEIAAIERLRDAPGSEALEEHHGESIGPGRGVVRGEGRTVTPRVRARAFAPEVHHAPVTIPDEHDGAPLWLLFDASVQGARLAALGV